MRGLEVDLLVTWLNQELLGGKYLAVALQSHVQVLVDLSFHEGHFDLYCDFCVNLLCSTSLDHE